MINWHQEPAARALLSQLDASRVDRVEVVSIPANFFEYVGSDDDARRIFAKLEDPRLAAIERALGCSFDAACADVSRRNEVLAALDAAPPVTQAIAGVL